MKMSIYRFLALLAVGVLAGCQSINLISANEEFISMVQQSNQAAALHTSGDMDRENYELTMEALQTTFNKNGEDLEAVAARSSDPRNQISFLNVATRNYVEAGAVGAGKVPGIAEEGWTLCQSGTPPVVTQLPTSCAYFLIATPQAIQNEQVRELSAVRERIQDGNERGGASVTDAKALVAGFDVVVAQIDTLDRLLDSGSFSQANPKFLEAVYRQQDAMYCTARRAFLQEFYLPDEGEGWNKAAAVTRMRTDLERTRSELRRRSDDRYPTC